MNRAPTPMRVASPLLTLELSIALYRLSAQDEVAKRIAGQVILHTKMIERGIALPTYNL